LREKSKYLRAFLVPRRRATSAELIQKNKMDNMHIAKINPDFNRHELIRLLGGGKSHRPSHSVQIKIEKLEVKLKEFINPLFSYRTGKIESINNGSVHIQEGPSFKSPKLSKTLNNCGKIICFIATIGDSIEKEIVRLTNENRLSDAYILDSMGSVAVENMVEQFYQGMKAQHKTEGKEITLRFSPGYCDWPVADQKKLFSLFDSVPTGVKLMDSCLMLPRKSISGIFGVLPSNMPAYNPCSECNNINCVDRRE